MPIATTRNSRSMSRPRLDVQSAASAALDAAVKRIFTGAELSGIWTYLPPCLRALEGMRQEFETGKKWTNLDPKAFATELKLRAIKEATGATRVEIQAQPLLDGEELPVLPNGERLASQILITWGAGEPKNINLDDVGKVSALADLFAAIVRENIANWMKPADLPAESNSDPFAHGALVPFASSLPSWEASNILTRRASLEWTEDENQKLRYSRPFGKNGGHATFWVTSDGDGQTPEALAGAAALQVIKAFDIRAVCMHLLYTTYSLSREKPWKDEFRITDEQIIKTLGLDKRTDLNRNQKLQLIRDIALQPSQIMTYIYYPGTKASDRFTIRQSRLWEISIDYHGKEKADGAVKEVTGLTIIGRAGLWAERFLNRDGQREKKALFEYGHISQRLLQDIGSLHHNHPGAAILSVWLLHKTRVGPGQPITVQTLLEVAYSKERLDQIRRDHRARAKQADTWEGDLEALAEAGWRLEFDDSSYPMDIRPRFAGGGVGDLAERPQGYWERLLAARMTIHPPAEIAGKLVEHQERRAELSTKRRQRVQQRKPTPREMTLSSDEIRRAREAKGLTRRQLAAAMGRTEDWIKKIETGKRRLTPSDVPTARKVLGIELQ